MTKCLDCGFLYPTFDEEMREYNQGDRDRSRATGTIPEGLGCFRGASGFPGSPNSGRVIARLVGAHSSLENEREKRARESARILAALEQEWDCELFAQHIPGLKPSEHLALQQSREWEAAQEQVRRAWERRQQEENQAFQEKLIDRQERFETDERRRDRRIAVMAWVIPLLVSTVVSLIIMILTQAF